MSHSLSARLRAALRSIPDPSGQGDLVGAGRVASLSVEDGVARIAVIAPAGDETATNALLRAVDEAALTVEGVRKVRTSAQAPGDQTGRRGGHDNPLGLGASKAQSPDGLASVKSVIAIASGKGGVGKSTLAANIAVAMARAGARVGFLDADITGPSGPTIFGVADQKAETRDGALAPIRAHGVEVMSIGMLVDPDQALAWRGPMVMGALRQLMNETAWGDLDALIVDTPPGTGDVQLSLIQSKRLTGVVVVSTPQALALADVRRAVSLFRKTQIPLLGVIENMAWLEAGDGARQYLFGRDGAREAADALDAPFLGAIPISQNLREYADQGVFPPADDPLAKIFDDIAARLRSP